MNDKISYVLHTKPWSIEVRIIILFNTQHEGSLSVQALKGLYNQQKAGGPKFPLSLPFLL